MTPREARRARREAERKAKKAEFKRMKAEGQLVDAGYSHDQEFSPELIAEANAARERVHRRAGITLDPLPAAKSVAIATPQSHSEPSLDWEPNRDQHGVSAALRPGHSTGPRSIQGKATSSRNSFKHGLASGQLIIPGEDAAEYESLLNALLDEHQPANTTEEMLVRELAQSYWLMQRAMALQNDAFTATAVNTKQLTLFLRYYTTYERVFHRTLNALMRLKKEAARAEKERIRQFVSQSRNSGRQFVSQKQPEAPSQPATDLPFTPSDRSSSVEGSLQAA
jgi:hypothetical protein